MMRYGQNIITITFFFLFSFFFFSPLVLCQLNSTQRTSMNNLLRALNGSGSWDLNKEPNPCFWKGVECDRSNTSVIRISLSGLSISSSDFLPIVCKIDSLQDFDVSNNGLSKIPDNFLAECGGIKGLKLLNFSKNRLVGSLPKFVGFPGLEFLDFSYNSFSGNVSLDFQGLKSLNLSFNTFTGSIPTQFGKSKVLEELVLSVNHFEGTIPEEIVDYPNLTLIDLSQNKLVGSIPRRLGELSKLKVLILSSNRLTGDIPQNLSNITTLSRFAANQNNFNGSVPSGLTKVLRNLDLSYNKLTGSIPSDLLSPSNLQFVDLSNNFLEGSIPEVISPSLVRLRLGSNSLDGVMPKGTCKPLQNLTYLELDGNKLSGTIPTELGSCQKLALLNLAQNKFTGFLPYQLGNLSKLEVLKLQLNDLSGEIPVVITQLHSLSLLNFSWNSLSGSIPASVSSLQNLVNLNLQGNKLSGNIPITIGSMNSLLELQLGENQLSGSISQMPPNLQIALNLSSNLFEGPIPKALARLTGLEVLDLSNNKFSGEIPPFLTELKSLTQLSLSNNSLSGVIPKFGSFVLVDVKGNNGLINVTKSSTPSSKSSKGNTVAVIVLSVAASLIAVVSVYFLVLVLSRRYGRVNDDQSQPIEDFPSPQILQGNLLTANGIHRSNIDFTRAMASVADPLNIVLKTRFSTYYKAIMPSGSSYFVKKLNWSDKIFQLGSHDRFGNELEVFGKLSNSNVMTPLAYFMTLDNAYLFYEVAPKGTLFDVLHGLESDVDWASRYSIAIGVAQGLAFLHGITSGPILLLDLSCRNIFLKSLKEPQVGDIELYKVIDPSKSTGSLSTVAGTVGYIPPEYAYTMRVTMAGNVYSFGVVLLELLTGKPAVSKGIELAKWVLSNSAQQDKWDQILDHRISRTSLAIRSQMLAVLKIALGCVCVSPESRPKMKSVLRMLLNAR
ncbi:hypothetical protein UlMin_034693 [Ulmus minor]